LPEIIVAIPTYKRPTSLARLLGALENLETDARVLVIVADNDAEGRAGYDFCRSICARYRWPLDPIVAEARGIAQARNALVERALSYPEARFVAMIDDDETPSPQWLAELLRVQGETGADVVEGSVLFDKAHGHWSSGFDGLSDMRRPTGPAAMLEGAGNLLITRACLEKLGSPWFDPSFALSGGEDRDFFERVKAANGRFAWADDAVAHAPVPERRMSLDWVLRRAYGIGNTEMRIFLKYRPNSSAWFKECAKIASALILSPVLAILLAAAPHRAADALRRFFRNAGKLAALMGRHTNFYAVTHGD
jgi:glycosyltransferase involved in cell wall biosynthesis